MMEYVDGLKYILSSDTVAFLVVAAGAWVYLMKYKPAMERKNKLEQELEAKILAIPTTSEITKIVQDSRDEVAELAILDSHKQEIIKQVEKYMTEMRTRISEVLGEQAEQQNQCVGTLKGNFQSFGDGMDRLLEFMKAVKEYIRRSETRMDTIEKRLEKIMVSLKMTYALLDAFVSRIEDRGDIAKIDRKSIDDFKENIQITQGELNNLMEILGKFMNQSKSSSRLDRFLNEE